MLRIKAEKGIINLIRGFARAEHPEPEMLPEDGPAGAEARAVQRMKERK